MISVALLFAIVLMIEVLVFILVDICLPFFLVYLLIKKIRETKNTDIMSDETDRNFSTEKKSNKGEDK